MALRAMRRLRFTEHQPPVSPIEDTFWDHDCESGEPDETALVEVAPDLATFLDRLAPSQ